MTREDFNTYRRGFANLLACGRSGKPTDDCTSGWLTDLGPLVPDGDRKFASSLMDYYVGVLRADPAKVAKLCGR
jgi:hypothetical protein